MVHALRVGTTRVAITATLLAGLGCRDRSLQPRSVQPHLADYSVVTSAMRAGLGPDGRFNLDSVNAVGVGEITDAQVQTFGRLWIRDFLPQIVRVMESRRGIAIHTSSLAQCGRLYRAQSPWEPIEDPSVPQPVKRLFGSWWFVTYCDDQGQAILLGVAAYNTDITLVNDSLRFPPMQGNSFFAVALSTQQPGIPLTPESVAVLVNHRTGALVASVPNLVMPGDWSPSKLLWHVTVDHAVPLTRDVSPNQPVSTQDVYVGAFDGANEAFSLRVVGTTQPAGQDHMYKAPHIGEPRASHPLSTVHVTRMPDHPAAFDGTH